MNKLFSFLIAVCATSTVCAGNSPLWLRNAKISPDGQNIAFTYKGDIYTVPTKGGKALRITTSPTHETSPVWSPDSKSIAFASDRNGNFDVFVVAAQGGTPRRLTHNSASEIPEAFAPDGKTVLFSASIQDPVESAVFPTARMTELYQVSIDGKSAPTQILGTPAQLVNFVPGKKQFVYQDLKGYEDEWRKHHTSSITRDIWLYDQTTGSHTNLTNRGGEDRNPVVAPDGTMYFLSERDKGSMNVYAAPLSNPSQVTAVTNFKTHPVRFLSRANDADGTLCFTYHGEIYTLAPGANKPQKVDIEIIGDFDDNAPEKLNVKSASDAVVSPDGKSVAFTYRGDVFVTSVDYSTTKQITNTPEAEGELWWAPDSKSLTYTSERDGIYNIYRARMGRPDDEPNFPNATIITEQQQFKPDGHERTVAKISPDGKELAFILDRNKLMVKNIETGKVRQLTNGSTYPRQDGGFYYQWSPDSKWIVLEIMDRKRDPYTDIALINVATGELTNITNSAYFDERPKWVLDGNAIAFASERYGMRNHASWGSMYDIMLVFLNQKAYERFTLDAENLEIAKDAEKKSKDSEDKDKDKTDKKDSKDIDVQLNGIDRRMVRLTPQSVDLVDAMLSNDGETLYYIATVGSGNQLWKVGLREPEFKLVSKVDKSLKHIQTSADGKTMYILGNQMKKFEPKSDKLTSIDYSATMKLDPAREREYMFDNMAREEAARFYVADMHGVDWKKLTAEYRKFLPHINNNYDFAEMVSELLGELNVSHTGSRFRGTNATYSERTASLGLLYDLTHTGDGLKVAEVVENGPVFMKADSRIKPGMIIEKINNVKITPDNDYTQLLTDIAGKKTLVNVYDPQSRERWYEVIVPESSAAHNKHLYERWVRQRAADVDRWSNGRLGYVHIESMNDASFRKIYSDLLGKYNDRDGVVIDIRWNSGGRLHEDIEVLFSGEKYFTQEIRGTEICDMPSRRWNKPSIMLMNEACYSNAHGTPWVYKHQGLGKLVGMPVAGTMTSVNWVYMQDPTLYFGIPVVGYRLPDGSFLENSQLEPDVKVPMNPAVIVKGEDAQLKAAVDELMKELRK